MTKTPKKHVLCDCTRCYGSYSAVTQRTRLRYIEKFKRPNSHDKDLPLTNSYKDSSEEIEVIGESESDLIDDIEESSTLQIVDNNPFPYENNNLFPYKMFSKLEIPEGYSKELY